MYTNLEAAPTTRRHPNRALPFYGWLGIAIMAAGVLTLLNGIDIGFTAIMWTGYILLIDAIIWTRGGYALVKEHPRELLMMLLISNLSWILYEGYNLKIVAWWYVHEPRNPVAHLIRFLTGYAIITPALLQTAELLNVFGIFTHTQSRKFRLSPFYLALSFVIGLAMATFPLLVSTTLANMMVLFVWLAFIFLLEPVNALLGGPSLFRQLSEGRPSRALQLMLGGLICGLLFELLNQLDLHENGAGWYYHIAGIYHIYIGGRDIRIGEMPILGFGGYPPFAMDCYIIYAFFKSVLQGNQLWDAHEA
jgi:hypothetical protein